ncbi:MAG: MFS transporter [Chloroflexi bacterium]|nr:MFS transporter [Chloroflexota bacterium]
MPFVQGLMPVYAEEVFGVGPTGLGLLLSSLGVGSTIGTFVLASLGDYHRKGLLMLASLVAMGLATVAFSLNPSYRLAFPNLLVLSGAMIMFASTSNAAVQSVVKDDFRGRVSGVYMATWGFTPLGSLLAGGLADRLGAPAATLMAAGVLVVVLAGLARWFRPLWRYQ